MERVIALLREKNDYLEQFHAINEHELINFVAGEFENVEAFYQARDKILELIRFIDGMIAEENTRVATAVGFEVRNEVDWLLKRKDEVVGSILAQDLQIIEYIEKEKSKIIRELRTTNQARRAVGAYAVVERAKQIDD
jgi:tyrosine-protein phosphatase YwqE